MPDTLKILLLPFSWLYAAVVFVRNVLYDDHILPSKKVDIPVICVGNLAVGGTGKTPMVEYLLDMLTPHYKVAVLSLGYGRNTRSFRLAGPDDNALTIGDEPMQIHRAYPLVPVAVCKDRVAGIHQLKKLIPDLQGVILDDGFQYRRLRCDLNILLTAADCLYTKDHYLPFGTLRDNKYRAQKANIIVVTKCPDDMKPIDFRVISNTLKIYPYQSLCFAKTRYAEPDIASTPLIVTGIARPQYLLHHLRKTWPQAQMLAFPDHHYYTPQDVEKITTLAESYDTVVVTPKDMERFYLTDLPQRLGTKLQVFDVKHDLGDSLPPLEHAVMMYMKERNRTKN